MNDPENRSICRLNTSSQSSVMLASAIPARQLKSIREANEGLGQQLLTNDRFLGRPAFENSIVSFFTFLLRCRNEDGRTLDMYGKHANMLSKR